jgi:hypothetical protein
MRGLSAYGVQRCANSLGVLRQRDAGAAIPSPLLDGLVAYWTLDEGSGTRVDSHGSNNLSDNNTVGSATGKIGNAASFVEANSEYLDLSSLNIGSTTASFAVWFYPNTLATQSVFTYGNNGNNIWLLTTSGGTLRCYAPAFQLVDFVTPYTPGQWYFVYGQITPTLVTFRLNEAEEITVTPSSTLATSATLTVGARSSGSGYFDGRVDEVGIWSRVLTASERTQLYNSGSGLTYPF